jgi:uncharacterized membrane protein YbaN (DUF454 family)
MQELTDLTSKLSASLRDAAMLTLGSFVVLVGIAGLFLPIIPGMLIVIAGVVILESRCPWAGSVLQALRRRFPSLNRFKLIRFRAI